jgi:serine/threonine protein kinase
MDRYLKIDKLGEGTYGVVYKAQVSSTLVQPHKSSAPNGNHRVHGVCELCPRRACVPIAVHMYGTPSLAKHADFIHHLVLLDWQDRESGEIVALKRIRLDNEEEGVPFTALREISLLKELVRSASSPTTKQHTPSERQHHPHLILAAHPSLATPQVHMHYVALCSSWESDRCMLICTHAALQVHPNVVKLYNVLHSDRTLTLVFEYCKQVSAHARIHHHCSLAPRVKHLPRNSTTRHRGSRHYR